MSAILLDGKTEAARIRATYVPAEVVAKEDAS